MLSTAAWAAAAAADTCAWEAEDKGGEREGEEGDHDQDQDRDTRPDHFERRVVAELCRDRVPLLVVAINDPAEQAHDEKCDRNNDPQQDVMETIHLLHDRRDTELEAEASIGRLSDDRRCEGAGRGDRGER